MSPTARSSQLSPLVQLFRFSVSRLHDEDGRPLGEQREPDLYGAVATELRRCPYPDSRKKHNKPMNVSALRQITGVWKPLIRTLAFTRLEYGRRHALTSLNFFHLWRLSLVIGSLPQYLAWRSENRIADGSIPGFASATYKVVLGVNTLMAERAILDVVLKRYPFLRLLHRGSLYDCNPEQLYKYIEAMDRLSGPVEVCAGPANMIRAALSAFMNGSSEEIAESGFPDDVPIDFDAFFQFGEAWADLILAYVVFLLFTRSWNLPARAPRWGIGFRYTSKSNALRAALYRLTTEMIQGGHDGLIEGAVTNLVNTPRAVRPVLEAFAQRLPAFDFERAFRGYVDVIEQVAKELAPLLVPVEGSPLRDAFASERATTARKSAALRFLASDLLRAAVIEAHLLCAVSAAYSRIQISLKTSEPRVSASVEDLRQASGIGVTKMCEQMFEGLMVTSSADGVRIVCGAREWPVIQIVESSVT